MKMRHLNIIHHIYRHYQPNSIVHYTHPLYLERLVSILGIVAGVDHSELSARAQAVA